MSIRDVIFGKDKIRIKRDDNLYKGLEFDIVSVEESSCGEAGQIVLQNQDKKVKIDIGVDGSLSDWDDSMECELE